MDSRPHLDQEHILQLKLVAESATRHANTLGKRHANTLGKRVEEGEEGTQRLSSN